MTLYFTNDETWLGGYYELAIEIGARSDEHLLDALIAIWTHPTLEGCYLDRQKEPSDQPRIKPSADFLSIMHHQGIALLPNGCRIAWGTCLIREEDEGPDWLDFYLPMGILNGAYDIGSYPFDDPGSKPEHWQPSVDEWLAELGEYVYSITPFQLGLIGFEISGEVYSTQINDNGIPAQRDFGYLWPQQGMVKYFSKTSNL
jgi:hypothetical protein